MTMTLAERLRHTAVHGNQEQAIAIMVEAADELERLRAALRMVLENVGGHQHWDSFGTAGANCPICERQLEAARQARCALEGKAP